MMRILLVNKYFYRKGGAETYFFALAEGLKELGHEVAFFSMKHPNNEPSRWSKFFVSEKDYVGEISAFKKVQEASTLIYSFEAKRKFEALLEEFKPDIIHMNNVHRQLTLSILDAPYLKKHHVPVVYTAHDYILLCPAYTMVNGRGEVCDACLDRHFMHATKNVCVKGSRAKSALATMAQLAEALLPFGWTLDWQAPDWLVPGGFFSLESQTPIEAIKYLADAAGGFVLPHQRERHLVIKPRYPTVPWQLDGALADVAIPRAIITTLGSDFQPGQAANGIYVSGGHQGINARVLRQGTAGDRQAPAITHPLVCDVVAARAQGVVGLAKTMPRRTQTIELPLSSDTGLILPGALLAVDGWKGFNRGVRVAAGMQGRAMTVRQQLSVERFV